MAFQNINTCRSFNATITTGLVALSSQVCSEVVIYNRTGQTVEVYDNNYANAENAFILSNNDSFVVRGITNSSEVSAKTQSASGTICYRTQFFSNFTQGV
jgi:hypothetical protein